MRALLSVRDPSSLRELESVLLRRGWEAASVGEEELTDAYRRDPRRIVVVQETARGSGSESCREIRGHRSPRTPYLIGITWQNDDAAIRRLAAAGVDDLLAAPFAAEEAEAVLALAEARMGVSEPPAPNGTAEPATLVEITRKLHVQQAFLEALFESAPEGVVILDESYRVARINGEFTRLFGYTPDEALGRDLNDLIVPVELRNESVELDVGVRRGERVMAETARQHRDGYLIDVSVLATHIDVNGPVGAFAIYRDITEKKRQEAALRESEARYRALFDQSPVGVFLCDRNLRITHCNDYLVRVIAMPYEDIVGAHLLRLRNSRLLSGLRRALHGEPAFYEGAYRVQSGRLLYVSVQYAPLRDDRGEVIGGIGVLEDISHRVLTEKRLRAQAAEMERVNAALRERTLELEAAMKARNRLYSAMNHELRTPISSIMLYQELLMAGSLGPLSEDQLRALDHSHTATRHLLDLVRDILDLSKMEAGKVSVQPVEIRIEDLLDELYASMAPLTESYGSSFVVELAGDTGPVVTDPQRLRQILMNFVSNAAKYGSQNPIRLRCGRRENHEMVIEVVDSGIGIAAEDLENVFEDFVQLGSANEEGTGLGLAISRRLADLLGAKLEVESTLGVGSTFRVVLPASLAPPAEALL